MNENQQRDVTRRILEEWIVPRLSRIDLARRRQHALFAREKPDKWPVKIMDAGSTEFDHLFPEIPMDDPDMESFGLLCRWLRNSLYWMGSDSDIVPFILAQFGTGANLACVGMEPTRSEETYGTYGPPHPIGMEAALNLTPDDVKLTGTFKRALDFVGYAREMIDDALPVCKPDCQSPFSLACMIMGPDFFTMTIEDPEAAKKFLDFVTDLYVKSMNWCKEADDEPATEMEGGGLGLSSKEFGTSLSIDHAVMFSPEVVDELVVPSCADAARPFGGARIHYCGWREYLTRSLINMPENKLMNQGIVTNEPIPFDEVMAMCAAADTIYHGRMPIGPDEGAVAYVDKLFDWALTGRLLPIIKFSDLKNKPDCPWKSGAELAEYWYEKQP